MIKKVLLLTVLIYGFFISQLTARDLNASVAYLPIHSQTGADGKPSGAFIDLVKAMNKTYTEGNISISLYPFARSIANITSNRTDFHIPMIKFPNTEVEKFPFSYASECITEVIFILYSRADSSPLQLDKLGKYVIDTQRGHQQFFPFKINESNTIEQGVAKLLKGRIDGYIMEQDAVDQYIRKNKISNIRRDLYMKGSSCILIPKGHEKQEIDRIITATLRQLKKDKKLQAITQNLHQPYNDWQPFLEFKN